MAKFIGSDISVTVNSVDLSDHVSQVEVDSSASTEDVTSMGATNKEYLLGIGDATIAITFFQDYAAASVDATLEALAGSNTPFPVVVKPTSAAVSATNPSYTMQAILPDYKPLSGQVGSPSAVQVTFTNADQSGITRATS